MSKVTVIIPTFNRGYCLAESIQSVLRQGFTDFDLIVVDDGSTDNTPEIMDQFPGVQQIRLEENRGVSFARNQGIAVAKGEWIAFLDSDDLWEKKKLATQMKWVESHSEHHAIYTDEIWVRNGVRVNAMNKHRKYSGDIFCYCLPLCIVSPSSVLLHTELLKEVGGFDESMPVCEDYDLWLRIAKQFHFHFIEFVFNLFRLRRHSFIFIFSRILCTVSFIWLVFILSFNSFYISSSSHILFKCPNHILISTRYSF